MPYAPIKRIKAITPYFVWILDLMTRPITMGI